MKCILVTSQNKMAEGYVQDELTRLRLKLLEQVSLTFVGGILRIYIKHYTLFFVINRKSEVSQAGVTMEISAFMVPQQVPIAVRLSTLFSRVRFKLKLV